MLEAEPFDGNLWSLDPDGLGIDGRTHEDIAYHLVPPIAKTLWVSSQ